MSGNELYIAAHSGDVAKVRHCLSVKADPNQMYLEFTPIYAASQNGHTQVVRMLLESGADPNKNQKGSPMYTAVSGQHVEIMKLLAKHGADVDLGYGNFTPLYLSCQMGLKEAVLCLCQLGANVNQSVGTSENKTAPLYTAASRGYFEICRILLQFGADVNLGYKDYDTSPIYASVSNNHVEATKVLLRWGADTNRKNGISKSLPIHIAKTECAKILKSFVPWKIKKILFVGFTKSNPIAAKEPSILSFLGLRKDEVGDSILRVLPFDIFKIIIEYLKI